MAIFNSYVSLPEGKDIFKVFSSRFEKIELLLQTFKKFSDADLLNLRVSASAIAHALLSAAWPGEIRGI